MTFRTGFIAVVGRPNVGKSTLVNLLVGAKISITSAKPQTTRHRILGVRTLEDAQFVFADTPGFQTRHRSALNLAMNRAVREALQEMDAVLWVVEALKYTPGDEEVLGLLPRNRPVVLVVNKVDQVPDKAALLPYLEAMAKRFVEASARSATPSLSPLGGEQGERAEASARSATPSLSPLGGEQGERAEASARSATPSLSPPGGEQGERAEASARSATASLSPPGGEQGERAFAAIVPVSALNPKDAAYLLDVLKPLLPQMPPLFEAESITDRSERFLAAEILREKVFRLTGDEIPYAVAVTVERFEEEPPTRPEAERGLIRIDAVIWVDREGHRPILLGHKGERMKRIATEARQDMERLFGAKVFLSTWVKVKSGWTDSAALLKRMGYE